MVYSKVIDPPVRKKIRIETVLVDGSPDIQDFNYMEEKSVRFGWITNNELQNEVNGLESESVDGWVVEGVSRSPVIEQLDLYFAEVKMHRYLKLT